MKNSPESFAAGLATMPFFLALFVVFGSGSSTLARVVAGVALLPAAALALHFAKRYRAASKAYTADLAEKRERLARDIKAENMRRYLNEG